MNNYSISLASISDKPELLTFFQHYQNQDLINKRVDCYFTHNFTVVAKDQNKIVGVLQWYQKEDPKSGVVEFEEVYVLEDYRGQGIATAILKFAIQSVKDYFKKIKITPRKIYLFVGQNNSPARHLYEKLGFKNIAPVGNLFSDPEPELFYCLSLDIP